MSESHCILVLADQLSWDNPALVDARPGIDTIVMAEVAEEANYVRHNRHKIVLLFSAMRHFAQVLAERGFSVRYFRLSEGLPDLEAALKKIVAEVPVSRVRVCAPGEYRLWHSMQTWTDRLGVAVDVLEDTRFLCTLEAFNDWAGGKKQLRMEFF